MAETQYITRRLVRQEDGTLRVAYVNTHSGQEVTDPFSGKYSLIEQGINLDFLNQPAPEEDKKTPTTDTTTPTPGTGSEGGGALNNTDNMGGPTGPSYSRSPTNNFGYIDKPGIVSALGYMPGMLGMAGKAANLGINANNVAAVNSARGMLGLDPVSVGQAVKSGVFGNKGYVGDVTLGPQNTQYSVGLEALDPAGRTTLTPNEARTRSMIAGTPVQEVSPVDRKAAVNAFQAEFGTPNRGLIGNIVQAGKNVLSGFVSNPTTTASITPSSQTIDPSKVGTPAQQNLSQVATQNAMQTPAPGVVTDIANIDTGTTVSVTHPNGFVSSFSHLASTSVEVGQTVEAGTPIGQIDATKDPAKTEHYSLEDPSGQKVDASRLADVPGFDPSAVGDRTATEISKGMAEIGSTPGQRQEMGQINGALDTMGRLSSFDPATDPMADLSPSFAAPGQKPGLDSLSGFSPASGMITGPLDTGFTSGVNAPAAPATPTVSNQPTVGGIYGVQPGIGAVPGAVAQTPDISPAFSGIAAQSLNTAPMSHLSAGALASLGFAPRDAVEQDTIGHMIAGELSPESLAALNDPNAPNHQQAMQEVAAVASVVDNRQAANPVAGLAGVLNPSQFNSLMESYTDKKGVTHHPIDITNQNFSKYSTGIKEALSAYYAGLNPSPVPNATNYANLSISNPSWASAMTDVAQIGPHTFGTIPGEYAAVPGYTSPALSGLMADYNTLNTVSGINALNQTVAVDPATQAGFNISHTAPSFGFQAPVDQSRFSGPTINSLSWSSPFDTSRVTQPSAGLPSSFDTGRFAGPSLGSFDSGRFGGVGTSNASASVGAQGHDRGYSGIDSTAGHGFADGAPGYGGTPGGRGGNASASIGGQGHDGGYSGIDSSAGYGFGGSDSYGGGSSYGGSGNSGSSSSGGGGFGAGGTNSNGGYGGLGGGSGVGGSYGGGQSASEASGAAHGGQSTAGTGGAGGTNEGGLGGWGGW